jgi:hypothetical protein
MKKILLATATFLALAGSAHASGWQTYYDCENRVVAIISGWHGKMWLDVQDNQKVILEDKKFFDGGIDRLEENPQPLNVNVNNFRFRVKWLGKTVVLRYRRSEDDNKAVTFARTYLKIV